MLLKNSETHKSDEAEFKSEIRSDIENGKPINVFCSFTYITPNYSILFTLNELKNFVDKGDYKVFLVVWDMNTLANPYFKRMCSSRKISDPEYFIDNKVKELGEVAKSIGFDKEKLSIYKSSDLWKRLISYKEKNIFQDFYSVMAQMKIKDYVNNNKVSHLVQIPMDIFFCNYFDKLYPEDVDKPMDLAFFGSDKEKLYLSTRDLMVSNGLVDHKSPLFVLMKKFTYLIYNHNVPEWNMPLKEIHKIVVGANPNKKEIFDLFRHIALTENKLIANSNGNRESLEYGEFIDTYKNESEKNLGFILSENLFSYLKNHRKKHQEYSGKIEESVLNITNKKNVKQMGQVLKSNIALEIMSLADGTRTTSQISKHLGKSVATISTYANRLKKMNLIRMLPDGNLKRNIKGIKVNFELGLSD